MILNKASEDEVIIENLSFLDIFEVYKYLDNVEIAKRAFGVIYENKQLFESISKLKKSIILNRNNFKLIKYNRKTVGFIQVHYDSINEMKIGIVIGYKDYWGKNIGTIALKKFIDKSFKENKKLDKVFLDTATYNIPAKKCFQKVGFKVYKEDESKVYMVLSREDFYSDNFGG